MSFDLHFFLKCHQLAKLEEQRLNFTSVTLFPPFTLSKGLWSMRSHVSLPLTQSLLLFFWDSLMQYKDHKTFKAVQKYNYYNAFHPEILHHFGWLVVVYRLKSYQVHFGSNNDIWSSCQLKMTYQGSEEERIYPLSSQSLKRQLDEWVLKHF